MAAVCVLGLGNMGLAMARRLRHKNFSLSVWNRSPAKALKLEGESAPAPVVAATVAAAAVGASDAKAPVLCTLADTAAVISLLRSEGFGSALQNRTFINLVSGNPDEGREIAQVHREVVGGGDSVCRFIDGTYSGSPEKARQGAGQLFLGSDSPQLVDEASVVLSTLGSVKFYGAVGANRAVDYAVVDLFFVNFLSFMSNRAALEKEGVDIKQVVADMKERLDSLPAALEAYDARMQDRSDEGYNSNPTVTLSTARNYWASRLPYNESHGIPSHLTNLFVNLLDEAAGGSNGPHAGADLSRLQEVVRYGNGGGPTSEGKL